MTKRFRYFYLCLFFLSITLSHASASPLLEIITQNTSPKPGESITAAIQVSDIPPVYGAEMILTFDPDILEVTDIKGENDIIQIKPGDFFDLAQSHFSLQNHADNQSGHIYYSMSMLNPAPEAGGNGTLAHITFRAKAPGNTMLAVEKIKFGTREGNSLVPTTAVNERLTVVTGKAGPVFILLTGACALFAAGAGIIVMRRRKKA